MNETPQKNRIADPLETTMGKKEVSETIVESHNTAQAVGSGDLPVLATPAMIALMENAAMKLAQEEHCTPEQTTVGTKIEVVHTRATGLGATVTATACLTDISGRKLTFRVTATDPKGEIGQGIHERYIVDREKFLSKL